MCMIQVKQAACYTNLNSLGNLNNFKHLDQNFLKTIFIVNLMLLFFYLTLFFEFLCPQLMEFYERASGARMHAAYVRPGGVSQVIYLIYLKSMFKKKKKLLIKNY